MGRFDPETVAAVATAWADPADGRRQLADPLPTVVTLASLDPAVAGGGTAGLGRRERDLTVVAAPLRPGVPFVISGPPRSGRSTALARLIHAVVDRPVVAHRAGDDPDHLLAAVTAWATTPRPTLFAIDDAELVDDRDGTLVTLVTRRHPAATIVVAVTASTWRQAYGTWLAALRPATSGLALAVEPGRDADCWSASLPRTVGTETVPGRAVLVDGDRAEVVQVAVDEYR